MFTKIRLKNFRSYKDSKEIPLRPLTVLVGPNNVGKSSIIKALLLLKQTVEDKSSRAALVTSGPFVEMGSFQHIRRGGVESPVRSFSIDVSCDASGLFAKGMGKAFPPFANHLSVSFSYDQKMNQIGVAAVQLSNDKKMAVKVGRSMKNWTSQYLPERARKHLALRLLNFMPSFRTIGKPPTSSKATREILLFNEYVTRVGYEWSYQFQEMRHIAPLRAPIPWVSVLGGRTSSDFGSGGENLVRILKSGTSPKNKNVLIDSVDHWISNRFKMLEKLKLISIGSEENIVSLVGNDLAGCKNINVAAMGEGISQLLPIVVSALMPREENCLIVEQPELHLHPAAQADLGDLFVENLGKSNTKQFIIETHSEHLLLRIRQRIADGSISPEKVALLFVQKQNNETTVKRLNLTRKGHFETWPEGFFEEGYKEALKLAQLSSPNKR